MHRRFCLRHAKAPQMPSRGAARVQALPSKPRHKSTADPLPLGRLNTEANRGPAAVLQPRPTSHRPSSLPQFHSHAAGHGMSNRPIAPPLDLPGLGLDAAAPWAWAVSPGHVALFYIYIMPVLSHTWTSTCRVLRCMVWQWVLPLMRALDHCRHDVCPVLNQRHLLKGWGAATHGDATKKYEAACSTALRLLSPGHMH